MRGGISMRSVVVSKDLSSSCQGGKGVGKRHLAECRVVRSQGLLRDSGLGAYCAA
jgi:hypothetical protein